MQFAIKYGKNSFDFRDAIMGRQSAGLGFLRAVVAAHPERLWCYTLSQALADTFAGDVRSMTSLPLDIRFIRLDEPAILAQAGLLYCGDPVVGDDAWRRQAHVGARSYSICGITHTLAVSHIMATIGSYLEAPLYSWDAVICTSRVARDVVRQIIENKIDYLKMKFGASTLALPQLPFIPLGIHCDDFIFSSDERHRARIALDFDDEDIVILYVGRLSYHAKSHPMPIFIALESITKSIKKIIRLVFVGKFPAEFIEKSFKAEAAQFCPSVSLTFIDGGVAEECRRAWASADIFTSLSDNIQETFGLTPVEAMAAGLPVVVSDWNGYKDTVRDGVDGFRVPTFLSPPGVGGGFATGLDTGLMQYDEYIGGVSLFTVVDVDATARAYQKLIESPELRRQMGAAGRQRARELYDWSIIFRRYLELWDELAERRRSDPPSPGEQWRGSRPETPDPFALFRTYPTATLQPETCVGLREGATARDGIARKALGSVHYATEALPSDDMILQLFGRLQVWPDGLPIRDLILKPSPLPASAAMRGVAWLAKMGLFKVL